MFYDYNSSEIFLTYDSYPLALQLVSFGITIDIESQREKALNVVLFDIKRKTTSFQPKIEWCLIY